MLYDTKKQRRLFIAVGFILLVVGSLASSTGTLIELTSLGYIRPVPHLFLILTMLSVVIVGQRLLSLNTTWLLCYTSIPLGLIWSIQEFTVTLSNLSDVDQLPNFVVNTMLPVFISGVACAVAFFCMDEDEDSCTSQAPKLAHIAILAAVPFIFIAGLTVTGFWVAIIFMGVHPILILVGCLLLGVGKRIKTASKTLREFSHSDIGFVLLDGGKVATFMGALVTALFYIALSRLDDPKAVGPMMALGLITILMGCFVYLIGICMSAVSCSSELQRNLRLDSWHLAEAYAFVLLALLAPASIFEFIV